MPDLLYLSNLSNNSVDGLCGSLSEETSARYGEHLLYFLKKKILGMNMCDM